MWGVVGDLVLGWLRTYIDREVYLLITISRMGDITICLDGKYSCICIITYGLSLGNYRENIELPIAHIVDTWVHCPLSLVSSVKYIHKH